MNRFLLTDTPHNAMTQQLQAAITASLAEVADRVTALETTARKNVIVAPDFTKLPLGPLGIILGFVVDEIGNAENHCERSQNDDCALVTYCELSNRKSGR